MTINLPLSTALCIVGAFLAMNFRYKALLMHDSVAFGDELPF